MAIQYKELFDFDGLDQAFKELEQSEDHFAKSTVEDLKRIQKQAGVTKAELLKMADALKKINVTNTGGRDRLSQLISDTEAATKAFIEQNNALTNNKAILAAVREEVARLKAEYIAQRTATEQNRTKAAEYRAEIERLKAAQQALRNELAQARVSQQQYNEETNRSRATQAQLREELARTRLEEARNTAEHRRLTQESQRLTAANRQASSAVRVASGSYREAQLRLTELGKSIRSAEGGFSNTTPAIKAQIAEYNRLNTALKNFDAQMGNHQRNVGNYAGSLNSVLGMLSGMAAGYLSAGAALSFAFEKNLNLDSVKSALGFTLGSTEAADRKLNQLRQTAEDLGLDFLTLATNYKSFAGAAIASNYSLKDTDRIFLSVSKAAAVLKLSNDQLGGALTAIQQMISKGNVQAEELRGQLGERLPGAFAIAARALGVTTQELDKMLKKGEVLASDLLPKLADELDKTFGNKITEKVTGLQAEWNKLGNSLTEVATTRGALASFFEWLIQRLNSVVKGVSVASQSLGVFYDLATNPKKFIGDSGKEAWDKSFSEIAERASEAAKAIAKNVRTAQSGSLNSIFEDQKRTVKGYKDEWDKTLTQIGAKAESTANKLNKSPKAIFVDAIDKAIEDQKRLNIEYKKAQDQYKKGGGNFADAQSENNAKMALQYQILLVKNLKSEYDSLFNSVKKGAKEVADDQLTSIKAIQKRITDLKALDGSAIEGSELDRRIKALQARLKELSDSAKKAKKDIKDAIDLLELDKKTIERSLQLQALVQSKNGTMFKPTDEALSKLDAVNKKLEAAKDILDYLEFRNKGLYLPDSAYNAIKALKPEKETPVTGIDGKVAKLTVGELPGTAKKAKAILDKNDPYKEIEHQIIDILESSFTRVTDIIGSQWTDMFASMTDSLRDFVDHGAISFKDFANIANGITSGISGTFKEASEARITALESERDREIAAVGDNASAKIAIEDNYNKKISAQKRKAAVQEKELALLSIAVNTAAAVMSVLSTGGGAHYLDFGVSAGILSAFVTGVGIAQAALVLAKPIPQFFKGTESSPEGPAEIAEKGAELLIHPDGSKELAKKRQIKWLRKGTKVKTAEETARILSGSNLIGMSSPDMNSLELSGNMSKMHNYNQVLLQNSSEKIDYDRLIKGFESSVKNIPHDEHYFDDRGYSNYRIETNTRIKNLNAVNSRKGNG